MKRSFAFAVSDDGVVVEEFVEKIPDFTDGVIECAVDVVSEEVVVAPRSANSMKRPFYSARAPINTPFYSADEILDPEPIAPYTASLAQEKVQIPSDNVETSVAKNLEDAATIQSIPSNETLLPEQIEDVSYEGDDDEQLEKEFQKYDYDEYNKTLQEYLDKEDEIKNYNMKIAELREVTKGLEMKLLEFVSNQPEQTFDTKHISKSSENVTFTVKYPKATPRVTLTKLESFIPDFISQNPYFEKIPIEERTALGTDLISFIWNSSKSETGKPTLQFMYDSKKAEITNKKTKTSNIETKTQNKTQNKTEGKTEAKTEAPKKEKVLFVKKPLSTTIPFALSKPVPTTPVPASAPPRSVADIQRDLKCKKRSLCSELNPLPKLPTLTPDLFPPSITLKRARKDIV
jgi:hypothetical protein